MRVRFHRLETFIKFSTDTPSDMLKNGNKCFHCNMADVFFNVFKSFLLIFEAQKLRRKTIKKNLFDIIMSDISPESTIPANANINDDLTKCTICDRTFRSNRGLNQHLRSNQHLRTCQSKSKENVSNVIPATLTAEEDASLSEIIDIESNVSTDRLHYKWGNFPDNIREERLDCIRKGCILEKEYVLTTIWTGRKTICR